MEGPIYIEPPMYKKIKDKYTDVDIIRSDVFLRRNPELKNKIVEYIKNIRLSHENRLEDVRKFYKEYLNETIQKLDTKGARIDLSTLAMAATRSYEVLFGQSGRLMDADQHYQIQEKRKKRFLIGFLAPTLNKIFYEKDKKKAEFKSEYDMFMHVMFGENLDKQIEMSKEYIERVGTYLNNVSRIMKEMGEEPSEMDRKIQEFYDKLDKEDQNP